MEKQDRWGKIIDKIFEPKGIRFYLILIFILAFILRLIAAINLTVSADDMHFVTHAINFLKADRLITYDQSSGLWFAFTDLMYKIFGTTQLASRMASLIFGSLSIFLIYFLSREFFNKKVSLIAAFLLAISPFHIFYTTAEMDVMAVFFVLFSMIFFIKGTKSNSSFKFFQSGIFIGLAIYTKVYPLLFIPSLILFFIYFRIKNKQVLFSKDNFKKISIFLITAFIFTIPALTHNYLLYKDKGFLDLQFTRSLGLGKEKSAQFYDWDAQFDRPNSWKGLFLGDASYGGGGKPLLLVTLSFIRIGDPINFYLGLLGIFFILFLKKEAKKYLIFYILSILFAWPFLASIIVLQKHFLFMSVLLIPISAFAIENITLKFSRNSSTINKYILLLFLVLSLVLLGMPSIPHLWQPNSHHYYGKSNVYQAISFKNKNIPEESLIVFDNRIYMGRANWMFQGRPYIDGVSFIELIKNQEIIEGQTIPVDLFYFECVPDDCGWGTVKDNPSLNSTMEELTNFIKQNGRIIEEITEPIERKTFYPFSGKENKEKVINIYFASINLKSQSLIPAIKPKNWFLYDIGYEPKEMQFDYYRTKGFLYFLLNSAAHFIVYLAVILSFISIIYVPYLSLKDE